MSLVPRVISFRSAGIRWRTFLLWTLVFLSGISLAFMSPHVRVVVMPAMALAFLALLFVVMLWNRDRVVPAFELGTLCVAATALYSLVPLLGFMAAGFQWTPHSDNRLWVYQSTPVEVGHFAWRHVLYLASFVLCYLVVRGKRFVRCAPVGEPKRVTVVAIVGLFAAVNVSLWFISLLYQIDLDPSYRELEQTAVLGNLPYVLRQILHNVLALGLIFKLCILMLLMLRWHRRPWRWVLIAWLTTEIAVATLRMGSRSELVLLLLSALLLHHRFVRPLKFRAALFVAFLFVLGFMTFGIVRNLGGDISAFSQMAELGLTPWTSTNEFQSLFGTAYDLHIRQSSGQISEVPSQLYFSDLYLIIPSQLLPFEKIDPAIWYQNLTQVTGVGLMFGVVAQAIIGWDWIELALRGAILALIFAAIHRWYVPRAKNYWVTLFYLFLCVWSYYTFRASTFYFVYFVVYRFIPAVLLIRMFAEVIRPRFFAGLRPQSSAALLQRPGRLSE